MCDVLEDLLHVQELDTTADQLRHRREVLPQRAAAAELRRTIAATDAALAATAAERDALVRDQRKREDEVARIAAHVGEEEQKLYSGAVVAPRELQALQQEVESLRRRQRGIEDEVLELMEKIEPLDAALTSGASQRAELEANLAEREAELARAEGEIAEELAVVGSKREEAATSVEAPLLERYERMREQLGGVAVARLVGSTCGGCHLTLSAVELDKVRHEPPEALVTCEECGRLLVR